MIADKYEELSVLGQGGMGEVLLCDSPTGLVAVKRMRGSASLEQFRCEARLLQGLRHPNLVCLKEYLEHEGDGYLVMEYIRGRTLAEIMASERQPSVHQVLAWGQQLCAVLEFLHGEHVLFRDLKPSNVMIDETGEVKLIDFGIARVHQGAAVTATFLKGMGSNGYSPIEQYQGAEGTDERSDIYALGATLYHALSGQAPISPIDLISSGRPMPSMRRFNPELPLWLDSVVLKMLAQSRSQRYQSAREAGQALKGLRDPAEDEQETEVLVPPGPSHDGFVTALAGLLTTVALGVFGVLLEANLSQAESVPVHHRPALVTVAPAAPATPVPRVCQAAVRMAPARPLARPRPRVPAAPAVVARVSAPVLPVVSYPVHVRRARVVTVPVPAAIPAAEPVAVAPVPVLFEAPPPPFNLDGGPLGGFGGPR